MSYQSKFKKTLVALPVSSALALQAGVALAEEKKDLFEVVQVTASKRTESIQEVPVSIAALSGDQLDALGLSDTVEITQQIPNFQVNAFSPQITIFNLRGVSQNNFVDNLEAPIAVYQDEAYVASMNAISGQMFDIERVEVLRGPQGTLFGRNATGGLVHYISRGADDNDFNAYVEGTVASFDRRAIEGAVGGELTDDVRGRFAFRHETADGYIEPDTSIASVDKRAIGGADGYGLRGTIEVDFSDSLTGEFIAKYSKDDDVPTGGYVFENCDLDADGFCPVDEHGRAIVTGGVASGDVHVHQNDTKGFLTRETTSLTAKLTKAFDNGLEFVSITNQLSLDKQYLEDGDAFPDPIVSFAQDAEVDQFTQEFRLSDNDGKLKWQVGAYYMRYDMEATTITTGAPNIDLSLRLADAGAIDASVVDDDFPFDAVARRPYELTVDNMSVFGQIDYDFTDTLSLTAGIRYSKDDKDIDWIAFYSDDNNPTEFAYAGTSHYIDASTPDYFKGLTDDTIDYSDYAARLSLSKTFSEDTMGFISWNRGIKGGNWTLSSGVAAERFQHGEEVLNSFEAGIKSQITDTFRLNGTVYYYDYDDYQTFVAIPPNSTSPNPQVGNSDATAYGAEFEIVASPLDNLDLMLGLALAESEVDEVESGGSPIYDAEFPNAPGVSGNYLARYFVETDNAQVVFQLDGAYYGAQFLELTNGPGTLQKAYSIHNASIAYEAGDWSVTAWVKNLADEEYKAYTLDLGILGATSYYAPPRTAGVTFKYSWY